MKRHYIVLLFLHAALAVLAGQLRMPQNNILSCSTDYFTGYTHDRNANITSLSRQGIIDKVGFRNEYGLHSRYTMQYSRNQLWRMDIEKEGADYEGRTGVGATGNISNFRYDANGNLGRDLSRDILETRYSRLNKPVDVYFLHGHRQTITYDGFGNKRRMTYSQTSDPILATMMGVPEDSAYTLQGRRDYIGPHVFAGDSLEYSAFPGGYFTPAGTFYYITDWQGNNIAVFSKDGSLKQQTTYYPYGEPTIEPAGQRWHFGGKEREHAGGSNSYDYGARNLIPAGSWSSADPLAHKFYPLSPFSYCGGDPINYVDPDGRAWRIVDNRPKCSLYFEWCDNKSSYDKNGNLKPGLYEQGIIFSSTAKEVVYNSNNRDYNIGTSIATVYKADGTTETFDACTVPSDPEKYATIAEGVYEAKLGKHKNTYNALRLSDVGTTDFYRNRVELGMPNPSDRTKTWIDGSNIHKAGKRNFTGITTEVKENKEIKHPISEGCILIDRTRWEHFISIFETQSQRDNVVGIILTR